MLFLREQLRDLRVQEFLRELVVGVAAPSNLAGSILVEILHSVEGGDDRGETSTWKRVFYEVNEIMCVLMFPRYFRYSIGSTGRIHRDGRR